MEDKWLMFQKFLIAENSQISASEFVINSFIIVLLGFILEKTYTIAAKSLSNRKVFAANFIMIAFTTMTIITIVKSSLALSLGLVGALSIVRFRSAIKEPEELAYLFFNIAIGLGLGASQRYIVLIAFMFIIAVIWLRYYITRKSEFSNLMFSVNMQNRNNVKLSHVVEVISKHFVKSELKRFDEGATHLEATFLVEIKSNLKIQACTDELRALDNNMQVSFLDHKSY